ncbi:MAG: M14 family zinc carboxypeptidase, partial [Planctomycetota bacterium]|nr:M14 family zinc carboxypeptidase [Planctomycetota bacterium]
MRTTTFAALCTLATASTAFAVDPVGYHTFEETESLLRAVARDSDIAELETLGQSAGGRAIHIIRLAGDGPVDPDERPALFVGANMAGFHNAGTEAAIAFLEAVDDRAGEEAIASLLRNRTIYVAPILNPDAHDAI